MRKLQIILTPKINTTTATAASAHCIVVHLQIFVGLSLATSLELVLLFIRLVLSWQHIKALLGGQMLVGPAALRFDA